ncbi:MAG: alpha/beta fold hydrolase, partial [Candidatus Dormibacteria bacterium]
VTAMPTAPPNNSTRPPDKPIELYYEQDGDEDGKPLLLIMGLSSQLIAWPPPLVADLANRGFRVIRFDNRDCGLSTHLDGVPLNPIWSPQQAPYFLTNMTDDAASLLDHLGVEQAHVVGASMGGMIAQLLTLNHPTRVSSLCSIMSTTGNLGVGQPTPEAATAVAEAVPPERENAIKHLVDVLKVIGSKTHFNDEEARRQVAEAYDRAFYPEGTQRQSRAIFAATDRTSRLRVEVTVPTVVIHGKEDSLIKLDGGQATANAISTAGPCEEIDGMGHDLPEHTWARIADLIDENAQRADA